MSSQEELALRYPRLTDYMRRLPRGLDSYPEVLIKALPMRKALSSKPLPPDPMLPQQILRLLSAPLLASSWESSAAVHGMLLALADRHHMTAAQYVDWALVQNRRMMEEKIYHGLLALASPGLLLRGASSRWSTFHRGIELVLEQPSDREVSATLRFPSFLLNEMLARGLAAGIQAALEASRAKELRFSVDSITDRSARMSASWR
ncbi:MAG TPA: hypothetical protein VGI39_28910 [Polyangiaceae bacterium]